MNDNTNSRLYMRHSIHSCRPTTITFKMCQHICVVACQCKLIVVDVQLIRPARKREAEQEDKKEEEEEEEEAEKEEKEKEEKEEEEKNEEEEEENEEEEEGNPLHSQLGEIKIVAT